MSIHYLEQLDRPRLAYHVCEGTDPALPAVIFLTGFKSDMEGTKALYLEEQCRARGQGFVRFDYSGHGASDGAFEDGTIGSWLADTLAVIDNVTSGPLILVGSSMGGWLALRAALERPERIAGLIGLAAAPDFTREIEQQLTATQKETMREEGLVRVPNDYSAEPYIFTRALIEDGERQCLLDKTSQIAVPVRLIQGMRDADVPWQKAPAIAGCLSGDDIRVILIKDGDHRLSREQDMAILGREVAELSERLKIG